MLLRTPFHRLEARCQDGFYLGQSFTSNESFVTTAEGVVRARTPRRRLGSEQWSAEFYDVSAQVVDSIAVGIRAPIYVGAVEPEELLAVVGRGAPGKARRVRIERRDLKVFGYTAGCRRAN